MSLQKKCFFASAGAHVLLVILVVFGTAFLSKKQIEIAVPLNLISATVVDALIANPGDGRPPSPIPRAPNPPTVVEPPAVTITPPTPVEPPKKTEPPVTVVDPPSPEKTVVKPPVKTKQEKTKTPDPIPNTKSPKKTETKTEPTPTKIKVNTKVVSRDTSEEKAKAAAATKAHEQKMAAIKKAEGLISNAGKGLSQSVNIEIKPVGGSGGVPFIGYGQLVVKIYHDSWLLPQETLDDNSVVQVSITISRNGEVVSARVTKASGNSTLDRSVRQVLDRVKRIGQPFPAGSKDLQKTFELDFSPKSRRLTG